MKLTLTTEIFSQPWGPSLLKALLGNVDKSYLNGDIVFSGFNESLKKFLFVSEDQGKTVDWLDTVEFDTDDLNIDWPCISVMWGDFIKHDSKFNMSLNFPLLRIQKGIEVD